MGYLGEFRQQWRPLAAASMGSAVSLPLFAYTNSAFAPHLIKEFSWSKAQFALVGLATLSTLLILPLIGRFTDRFGVRKVAVLGTVLVPLCFYAYSRMDGGFASYVAIFIAVLAFGSMTGPMVYSRLVAESFHRAQGLALTVVNSAPSLMAMILVPLLNLSILQHGWRTSYLLLGAVVLVFSVAGILLIPRRADPLPLAQGEAPDALPASEAFGLILRSKVFWLILAGMLLCLLQTQLHATQMNLMLIDNGLSTQQAAGIVSIYALSTIVGRIGCGLALDRFSTPVVAFVSMILPALGFLLLASDLDAYPVIVVAMCLAGLSMGAESDLLGFLVARYFSIRIYATTLSLLFSASFLSSAVGSLLISASLQRYGTFGPFLYGIAVSIFVGSLLFLFLPRGRDGRIGDEATAQPGFREIMA
ncbi:MAG: MFS transporter [Novosphingobium sp.]